jgi:1D-myo-inositol 3-kinase
MHVPREAGSTAAIALAGRRHRSTARSESVNSDLQFDYTTLGHVTVDVLPDGSRQPGGTAFYSALQAARLGQRTLIVTQGVAGELEALLEPYRGELELRILPAAETTTLATRGAGAERSQRVLAWAGRLPEDIAINSAVLHLAPVARETPRGWRGRARFTGLTPQGLVRTWDRGGEVSLTDGDEQSAGLAGRCDALVMSRAEQEACAAMIRAARAAGAVVAVTAEERPITLLQGDGEALELPVAALEAPRGDLGAGDVFAAAFFVALAGGRPAQQAAEFAHAAAAVRLQGADAGAIGRRAALDARLAGGEAPSSTRA